MSAAKKEQKVFYRIVVKGHLDEKWIEWFDGMSIKNLPKGEALLSGPVSDQAELHGMLIKIRDLGLPLISVGTEEKNKGGIRK